MSDDQNRISVIGRIGSGMLFVVVVISFAFDSIWDRMISFFKK